MTDPVARLRREGTGGHASRLNRVAWALLASALILSACGGGDGGDDESSGSTSSRTDSTTTTTLPTGAAYRDPGPYDVGVRTFEMDSGNLLEVWYPASEGATDGIERDVYSLASWLPEDLRSQVPADSDAYEQNAYRDVEADSGGPFPLVLFSHGYASFRDQSTFLTTHLASWGMVVVAPDHPSRGLLSVMGGSTPDDATLSMTDLEDALARAERENARAGGPLEGRVDVEHTAAIGHSAGGGTILDLAADPEVGPRIDTYVSLASGTLGDQSLPDVPSLFMSGTDDDIVEPERTADAYSRAPVPKRYYSFIGAGHLAFTDICEIGADQGGVLALAEAFGIEVPESLERLASDGCYPDETPPRTVWPAINHFTTAHLRSVWGIDGEPAGLDAIDEFDGLTIEEQHVVG